MLDHVSITVSDIAAAERFYDAVMKALEIVKVGGRSYYGALLRDPDGNRIEAVCHHTV
jgi:catechol 2,3-dioxygenase-like lactoylglutathione lyase family enzyme